VAGWWRVRDIVEQQKIAAWATVDLAARNRELVLRNMYLKGIRQTERGAKGEVKAFAIAIPQHDSLTARKLVNMLLNSGVEVQQTGAAMTIDGRVYGPGSYIVSTAQPKTGLVRWMLGRTFYPDNSYTRDREGNPIRPYDMATDTFAEFMGVRVDALREPVTQSLTKVAVPSWPSGSVNGTAASGYLLSTKLNDSYRAVSLLLEKGATVRRVASADGYTSGDFVVTGATAAVAGEIAKVTGVDFASLPGPVPANAYALRKPRVAMYQRYGGGNMDEGWSRLMFEQFNIPVKAIMDAEIKKGDLNASYDVVILPADSISAMTGEPAGAGGGRGGRGGGGGEGAGGGRQGPSTPPAMGVTPPEYRSGFGADGVKMLQAFVQKGGTLVTFGQAGDLPIQRFSLPVRNVVDGLAAKEFWCPGSTLRVRFDPHHPIAFGLPRDGYALFLAGSQAYEVTTTSPNVEIFATFVERELLQSGWLIGEHVIAKKAAALTVAHGDGRVVLLGFRPQHRDQTHGTFKLVFNSLFNGPSAPAAGTTSQVR
jgi:hypothetical protein